MNIPEHVMEGLIEVFNGIQPKTGIEYTDGDIALAIDSIPQTVVDSLTFTNANTYEMVQGGGDNELINLFAMWNVTALTMGYLFGMVKGQG